MYSRCIVTAAAAAAAVAITDVGLFVLPAGPPPPTAAASLPWRFAGPRSSFLRANQRGRARTGSVVRTYLCISVYLYIYVCIE